MEEAHSIKGKRIERSDSMNSNIAYMIDRYVSGGVDPYGDDESERCCYCGNIIREGEEHYNVDNHLYCMDCEEFARDEAWASIRDRYIFEM